MGIPGPKLRSATDRFWSKVRKTNTCWIFQGSPSQRYGFIHVNEGFKRNKNVLVHRFTYELLKGPIPKGFTVDHTCHNSSGCSGGNSCKHRKCVNPGHLEAVLIKVNVLRGAGLSAINAKKQFCRRGHPFSGPNLRLTKGPYGVIRECRTCRSVAKKLKRQDMDMARR